MTLRVEQLGFERHYQMMLKNINFQIQSGECLQISGKNGSGKSTLLRLIAGFLEPTTGRIQWNNQPIAAQRDLFQQQLHYVGHQHGMKSYLTVLENLKLIATLANIKKSLSHLQHCAEKMGLKSVLHHTVLNLSAGQVRRLTLTRLLISPSSLWILDEPTTALDQDGQRVLIDMLKKHITTGGMVIVATHHDFMLSLEKKTIVLGES